MKLLPCVLPFNSKNFAPRVYLGRRRFEKFRKQFVLKYKCCQACESDLNLELHESFAIKDNVYHFLEFILLCRKCHKAVHITNIGTLTLHQIDKKIGVFDEEKMLVLENITKMSRIKLEEYIFEQIYQSFSLSLEGCQKANYEGVEKYGFDKTQMNKKFTTKNTNSVVVKNKIWFASYQYYPFHINATKHREDGSNLPLCKEALMLKKFLFKNRRFFNKMFHGGFIEIYCKYTPGVEPSFAAHIHRKHFDTKYDELKHLLRKKKKPKEKDSFDKRMKEARRLISIVEKIKKDKTKTKKQRETESFPYFEKALDLICK